ncbi:PREDICTED: dihydroflavonol-4-reductase isoform X2 [Theobroma cacao]|uniref:Dihydroflavonol-4-reductase isoform X2 n=1 Tax=Theobroma cacao TaxID=3641 RepID=A0AB32VNM5_THECC|nr:PREDICTED: dihydroflavonol-4-reductase isoform X2 [Theobroma cacao]
MEKETKVCVTGAAGYLGSSLVKKLLEKGHIVHATARNLGDPNKIGLLKSLPNAETRLRLYEADIYNPSQFQHAIEGCRFVVHMATPLQHEPQNHQFKDTSEAAVAGVKSIVESCIRSGSVKRLIYTASVVAASALKEDGEGFKDQLDESCWTPKDVALPYTNELLMGYVSSKAASEKELLRYDSEIEIVSLTCGLVGGDTLHSSMPESTGVLISQATKNKRRGRLLCASAYLSSADIANHCRKIYPDIEIPDEFVLNSGREILWGSTKLKEIGFEYKCDVKTILEDSINCGLKLGEFSIF